MNIFNVHRIFLLFFVQLLFCSNQSMDNYCPIDIISDPLTGNKFNEVKFKRDIVRQKIKNNYFRNNRSILSVPVVFHNLHRQSERSFCDYLNGFGENANYDTQNNPEVCNERALKALEILNEQFASADIQFTTHEEYPIMNEIIDNEYEHITTSNFSSIKERYNFPNVINIYLDYCLGNSTQECSSTSAWSTYPWNLSANLPGIAIKHSSFPDMNDLSIAILPHEIGHYFSLLHINGTWMWSESNPPRELVSGDECEIRGDLICDTPGQPGYGGGNSFFTNVYENERICIYQGYGGEYDPETQTLQIGGSNNTETIGQFTYSNQDELNEFWGTRNIADDCLTDFQEAHASDCHLSNYEYLPHAINFLQPVIVAQYCGRRGYHEYDPGDGYTIEQFENIRYSLETDYTGCSITISDNYSENFLINKMEVCMFSGYYLGDTNQDNTIDILDAIISINYILDNEFNQLIDINQDGYNDILDIILIINLILS